MFKLTPNLLKSKFLKLILEKALNTCDIIVRKKKLPNERIGNFRLRLKVYLKNVTC